MSDPQMIAKVRRWVLDHAYAPDDWAGFVREDSHPVLWELLDIVDPGWRVAFDDDDITAPIATFDDHWCHRHEHLISDLRYPSCEYGPGGLAADLSRQAFPVTVVVYRKGNTDEPRTA